MSLFGNNHVHLLYCAADTCSRVLETLAKSTLLQGAKACHGKRSFILIESPQAIDDSVITALARNCDISDIRLIRPFSEYSSI